MNSSIQSVVLDPKTSEHYHLPQLRQPYFFLLLTPLMGQAVVCVHVHIHTNPTRAHNQTFLLTIGQHFFYQKKEHKYFQFNFASIFWIMCCNFNRKHAHKTDNCSIHLHSLHLRFHILLEQLMLLFRPVLLKFA